MGKGACVSSGISFRILLSDVKLNKQIEFEFTIINQHMKAVRVLF